MTSQEVQLALDAKSDSLRTQRDRDLGFKSEGALMTRVSLDVDSSPELLEKSTVPHKGLQPGGAVQRPR